MVNIISTKLIKIRVKVKGTFFKRKYQTITKVLASFNNFNKGFPAWMLLGY